MSPTTSAASSHGEGLTTGAIPPFGSCSVSGSEGPDALGLETSAGVYRYLRGRWDLEKTIDYKAGGMAGTWHGIATFSPQQEASDNGNSSSTTTRRQEQEQGEAGNTEDRKGNGDSTALLLLRYLEQGTFRVNGKGAGFEAGQRLVYDCSGRVVRVHFVDDPKKPDSLRFFHELDFRKASEPPVQIKAMENAGDAADTGGKAAAAATAATLREKFSAAPRAEFEHLCVRDMYRGQVEVVGPNEFRTRWHVTGPQKDGRIYATFKRAPPDQQGQRGDR